jgi:phosphatidylglycerophosphate synthase
LSGPDSNRNESSTRTREIEELTNLYFIHPIGARLTPLLARIGVSPNTVSFTGMACGILAGWAYYHYQDIRYAVAGFVLMVAWHILDGVDGQLARLTNSQSEFGKVIDGIADNVTFLAVYLALGLALSQSEGAWVWLIIALAGAAHSLQAASYEVQRQEYDFWGWDKKSAELKPVDTLRQENRPQSPVQALVYGLGQSYVRMQHLAARVDPGFRTRLAGSLAARPERAEKIRRQYRESFSSLVQAWSVMSSNYRTIAIFLCAAFNIPLMYFLIELAVLTPLTMLMLRRQRSKCRAFSNFLDQQAGQNDGH